MCVLANNERMFQVLCLNGIGLNFALEKLILLSCEWWKSVYIDETDMKFWIINLRMIKQSVVEYFSRSWMSFSRVLVRQVVRTNTLSDRGHKTTTWSPWFRSIQLRGFL